MNRFVKSTNFGDLQVIFHNNNYGGVYSQGPLTINKVEYNFHFEFVLIDGIWVEGRLDHTNRSPYRCYTSRLAHINISRYGDSATKSAYNKINEIKIEIFASLNAGHYAKYVKQGGITALKDKIHNLEESKKSLNDKLKSIENEIDKVRIELMKAIDNASVTANVNS
jgi:hypothetical protein